MSNPYVKINRAGEIIAVSDDPITLTEEELGKRFFVFRMPDERADEVEQAAEDKDGVTVRFEDGW